MSEKYPRTPHLPWSPGGTRDDRRCADVGSLVGVELVVTEKLDGSNVCLTSSAVYARSHGGAPSHPSFDALKALHAALRWSIPEGCSVFAEWCYAVHSIVYPDLPSGAELAVFGVRDDQSGHWLPWDDVERMAQTLGVRTAPVLWEGSVSTPKELEELVDRLAAGESRYGPEIEGVVVRSAAGFGSDEFTARVAKWVRADHVQTDEHWSQQEIRRHSRQR